MLLSSRSKRRQAIKRRSFAVVAVLGGTLATSLAAGAPDPTSNPVSASVDLRFFGGKEKTTYFGARAGIDVPSIGRIEALGDFARWNDFDLSDGGSISHGGTDLELRLSHEQRTQYGRYSGYIGVSAPHTPAQGGTHLTLGTTESWDAASGLSIYVNPRTVFIRSNSLVGIGIGANQVLSKGFDLGAEVTPLLSGDNTRDTSDGHRQRSALYKASLKYRLSDGMDLSVGYTNAIGDTTGFSLTPGLGNSGAFFISLGGKF